MERENRKHQHEWEFVNFSGMLPELRCKHCGLSVEIYSDHVSVWDSTKPPGERIIDAAYFDAEKARW